MLNELRTQNCLHSVAGKVKHFVDYCLMSSCTKSCHDRNLNTRLGKIHNPFNRLEDNLDVGLVDEMIISSGYTTCFPTIFSPSRFAVLTQLSKSKHCWQFFKIALTQQFLTDRGFVSTSRLLTELMEILGIKINHATLKQAQTTGMTERWQILKINVASDAPHWDRYFVSAVKAHNTIYHQLLKCSTPESFRGHVLNNVLKLMFSHLLQSQRGTTDIQTLVDQVNQKNKAKVDNIFIAFFQYKDYYDRKAQA